MGLPALVLAAGFSRRMGQCKLLLPLGGEPLIKKSIRAALQAGLFPVLVVVRPDAEQALLEAVADCGPDVRCVSAPDAHLGQSASLKAGLRQVPEGAPGVLVLLGDQPLIHAAFLHALSVFALESPTFPAAPICNGQRGNPVFLPKKLFPELFRLSGDTGARQLLAAHSLRLLPTNDTATLTDVDTWDGYDRLRRQSVGSSLPFFARKESMSHTPNNSVHFVTPPLRNGSTYANPGLPPLPHLWRLEQGKDAPIPDEAACLSLWTHYAMFAHIERHSRCVAEVATALARRALEIGATQHTALPDLCLAAGLLHDLAKSYTVQHGGSHAQIGASWVIAATGNHRVAQAVLHHVEWPWALPDNLLHPVFLVLYADKRARHDELVTLGERYEDLLVRYGKTEQSRAAILRGWEHSTTIERVLSAQLEFPLHESTVVGGRLVSRA